jgi:hypothetical protein
VLFRAVTNQPPPDAVKRLKEDTVPAALAAARGAYSEPFLRAIEWALAMDEKQRPQSVADWQKALFYTHEKTVVIKPAPPAPKKKRRIWPWIAAAALLVLGVLFILRKERPEESVKQQLKKDFEVQFRTADANADGYLSPDEVRGRFPMIAKEFARVDADNDGRISMREFLQFRRQQLERKFQPK